MTQPRGSDTRALKTNRIARPVIATLLTLSYAVFGGCCGALPGVVARKTVLAPTPGAGLEDLGPALAALFIGVIGVLLGALVGVRFARRALRREGIDSAAPTVATALLVAVLILLLGALLG
jgi:hypothetical protein